MTALYLLYTIVVREQTIIDRGLLRGSRVTPPLVPIEGGLRGVFSTLKIPRSFTAGSFKKEDFKNENYASRSNFYIVPVNDKIAPRMPDSPVYYLCQIGLTSLL